MAKKQQRFKYKIWLCLIPIILHVVLSVIMAIVSKNLPPLPHLSCATEEMKIKALFIIMCYVYYASIIFLFPTIFMARYYYIFSINIEKLLERKRGIKARIATSAVGAAFYLLIAIMGLWGVLGSMSKMQHFVIFFPVSVITIFYLVVTRMFLRDFYSIVQTNKRKE